MADLPRALLQNPAIPTPSWEPRCELCRLFQTAPEAYAWSTQRLLAGDLTQQAIADAMRDRWGIEVDQSQLSRHRTRHLLPDLQAAHEIWAAAQAVHSLYGDVDPIELGQRVAKTTIVRLAAAAEEAGNNVKSLGIIARSVASLNRALQSGELAGEELAALRIERAMTEEAQRAQFIEFIKQHYPHLVPALEEAPPEPAE